MQIRCELHFQEKAVELKLKQGQHNSLSVINLINIILI